MGERLGFIGLGIMGRGMVSNLTRAGHTPTVWNRTVVKVVDGTNPASSLEALARQSDLILIGISDAPDVKDSRSASPASAGSWMPSNRGPQMMANDWRPGFTIDLQPKDLRLVLDTADSLGVPLPGTSLIFQLYRALQASGLGHEGNHALIKALKQLAGSG